MAMRPARDAVRLHCTECETSGYLPSVGNLATCQCGHSVDIYRDIMLEEGESLTWDDAGYLAYYPLEEVAS